MNPFRFVFVVIWFGIGLAAIVPGLCWIGTGVLALRGKITESTIEAS